VGYIKKGKNMNVNKTKISNGSIAELKKECEAQDIAWFKLTKEERVKLDKQQTAEILDWLEREEA